MFSSKGREHWSVASVFAEWSRPYFEVQKGMDPSSSEFSGHLIPSASCIMLRALYHRGWSSPLFRQRLGTIGQMPHFCAEVSRQYLKMQNGAKHSSSRRCFGSGSAALPRRVLLSFSVAPEEFKCALICCHLTSILVI